jgi:hypothetical protein
MVGKARCAYLVNSTPKYYGMLPLHFQLIRRYAPWIDEDIDLWLATEQPEHPVVKQVAREFGVRILPLEGGDAGFLDSRAAALRALEAMGSYELVLPMQEDFLLDREPNAMAFEMAAGLLTKSQGLIASVRLMPSPAPAGPVLEGHPEFAGIVSGKDMYGFTFQATLWRLDAAAAFYTALCARLEAAWPKATTRPEKRVQVEVRFNFAENPDGQRFFWQFFQERGQTHAGWRRAGPWSNAVYLSPWPYRPTAIVQGRLEPWAAELAQREGVNLTLS